jgi:transposase
MLYVGLDIHSKHISICILNNNGKIERQLKVRQVDQMMNVLEKLPDHFAVCFEASCGYGHYHELLTPIATRVVVAHAGLLKLIYRSKKKNDRRDAQRLAQLLYIDQVPTVHVPSADVRAWRELIGFRQKLVHKRTRAKNGVRALLRTVAIQAPTRPGLWTRNGIAWLKRLEFSQPTHALQRDLLIDEIETLSVQLRRVEKELTRFSKDKPAVWQLQSIPGVGPRTAEAIVAFVDDPHRFPHSKRVGAYFGLVPSQYQSGDRNRMGHITREGPAVVRHFLAEATWQAVRRSPTVRAYFERIARGDKDRRKTAIVATAHYLVRVMWAMLKHGTLWKETAQAA